MKKKETVLSLLIISLGVLVLLIFLFVKGGLLEKFPQSPLIARILRLPIPIYVVPVAAEDSTRFIGANATSEGYKDIRESERSGEERTAVSDPAECAASRGLKQTSERSSSY
jgi:hypothetical protein